MQDLIINLALTGMVPRTTDNPHVPVTPEAIAEDVRRCAELGVCIFHLHARYADENPAWEAAYYRDIVLAIRERVSDPEIILCMTTSGRVHNTLECRADVLNLEDSQLPDMASLTLGSLNFPKQASVNTPEMIPALARRMKERGVMPELEVFELGMIDYSKFLLSRGVLESPLYYNLLLGSLGTLSATPLNLALMVQALPEGAIWAGAGIGRFQFDVNCWAITTGGHVRVGLEDNLFMDAAKTDPASNVRLVERIVRVAEAVGRPIAKPAKARELLGLKRRSVAQDAS